MSIPGVILGSLMILVSMASLIVVEIGRVKKELKIYNIIKGVREIEPSVPPSEPCLAHFTGTLTSLVPLNDPVFTNLGVPGCIKLRRVTEIFECAEVENNKGPSSDRGMGPGVAVVQQHINDHEKKSKVSLEMEWKDQPETEPLTHFPEFQREHALYELIEKEDDEIKVVYARHAMCGEMPVPPELILQLCNRGTLGEVIVTDLPPDCVIPGLHKVGHFYTNVIGSVPRIGDVRVSFYCIKDNCDVSIIGFHEGNYLKELLEVSSERRLGSKLSAPLLQSSVTSPESESTSSISLSKRPFHIGRIYHSFPLIRPCAKKGWRVGSYWSIFEGPKSASDMLQELHNDKRHLITWTSRISTFILCFLGSFLVANPFWCFMSKERLVGYFLLRVSSDGVWVFALYAAIMEWCVTLFVVYVSFRPLVALGLFLFMLIATLLAIIF